MKQGMAARLRVGIDAGWSGKGTGGGSGVAWNGDCRWWLMELWTVSVRRMPCSSGKRERGEDPS